jgi:penicillin-binding protein 1A
VTDQPTDRDGELPGEDLPRLPPPEAPPPRRKKGGFWGKFFAWLGIVTLVLTALAGVAAWRGWVYVQETYLADMPPLPDREALFAMNRAPAITFVDRAGQVIASRGPRFGDRVTLAGLPPHIAQAFLAVEDRRFYEHKGVDPRAILRAAYVNWKAKRVVEGGSTLTQQLAKGLFLTPERTLKRKIQEAAMAWRLEQMLSKDEVLELYLNRVYFGANTFGVDGAARTYFGKPASQMTVAEAALIASLPKAPSKLSLDRHMDAALERSHLVLSRMLREGWITQAQMDQAMAERPRLVATAQPNDGDFGWALDFATTEAIRLAGENSPDLVVQLTIDPTMQRAAAGAVRSVLASRGAAAGATQAAMTLLANDGAIRAMVGGTDYADSVFNRAVQARRQPGSSFKPFVYATALEAGALPSDTRVDQAAKYGDWEPKNYGGGHRGEVSLSTALALSINTVAVELANEVGPSNVAALAQRFGITTLPPNPTLSIALGAYEVNVLEMTSAFQVFQQAGNRRAPYIIEEIRTVDGQHVFRHTPTGPSPVYDTTRASMMVRMMQKVVTNGTGTGAAFGWPAAGKTGTSQNFRDAWFVGFTPEFTAGVWVGNDDDKPMNQVTGGAIPAQIWRDVMTTAHMGLAISDFDWMVPDLEAVEEPDPRNGFYEDLSREFARVGAPAEYSPDDGPPTPPIPPAPPEAPRAPVAREAPTVPEPWYRGSPDRPPPPRAVPRSNEPVPY